MNGIKISDKTGSIVMPISIMRRRRCLHIPSTAGERNEHRRYDTNRIKKMEVLK